jgi:hypothetical protein
MEPQTAQIMGARGLTNLVKGNEYEVTIYPSRAEVPAKYLGRDGDTHVFKSLVGFVFASNHWIIQEGNMISYTPISSASIAHIDKEFLKSQRVRCQDYIKNLENLGVKI